VSTRPAASDRRRSLALGALALALAAAGIAVLRLTLWPEGVPGLQAGDVEGVFDAAAVAADRGYQRGLRAMAVVGALLVPAVAIVLAALVWRRGGRLTRLSRGWVALGGAILGATLAAATSLALLPLGAVRLAWVRSHDVGRQGAASWLVDRVEALAVQAVILGVALALLALAIHYLPRTWWLALGVLVAGVTVALALLGPVLIAPRFEQTEPLRDPGLRAEIVELGARAGVTVDRVEVSDASRRTRALNARVEGLGDTRRVVLFDTLLQEAPRAELRWVIAHELAHAKHRHIEKGVAWVAVLALPLALLAYAVVGWFSGFVDARSRGGVSLTLRRTAIAAAAVVTLLAVTTPLSTAVSRAFEAKADWTALELTGDAEAAIAFRARTRELRRADPDPPRAWHLWFGTHPTAAERVGLAQRFAGERDGA
jgi:STE24 endopeptidase